jgi:uncharacterized protein YkwD
MRQRRNWRKWTWFLAAWVAVETWSASAPAVPITPTDVEQYMLELINRARANPSAEAARFNLNLNEGLEPATISPYPKQPLAFNFYLNDSARTHAQWMLDTDLFQHQGPGGNRPSDRARDAGYVLTPPWGIGENLAWNGSSNTFPPQYATTTYLHKELFVDSGIADRGHRTNLLNEDWQEAGIGILSGDFRQWVGSEPIDYHAVMIANEFAYTAGPAYLTGVIYRDLDNNKFYTPGGEGVVGVTVRAVDTTSGTLFETQSFSTGGYSLALPPGIYDISFIDSPILAPEYYGVTIGDQNLKLDLTNSTEVRSWTNLANPYDVDKNGVLEPRDILQLIDWINRFGVSSLLSAPSGVDPVLFLDVNRDLQFTPADLLAVIDEINRNSVFGSSSGGGGLLSYVETSGSIDSLTTVPVPEPTSAALLLAALIWLLAISRRDGKLFSWR